MEKKNTYSPTLLLLILSVPFCAFLSAYAEPWAPDSNPYNINRNYSAFLDDLPKEAQLPDTDLPWSGPYWAERNGSIAFRWQTNEKPWDYVAPSPTNVKNLSSDEIALLSPAEKFDILRARYDFPLLAEIRGFVRPGQRAWYGICTGWSQAALHFHQPKPITLMNPHGILVPFGSGDVKALASYYYAYPGEEDRVTARIGTRCDRGDAKRDCRRDVNAGALHILITNRLGLERKGLFADISRRTQVWQHPIYGFTSRLIGTRAPTEKASPLAVREVRVKTKLHFAKETDASWESSEMQSRARRLDYWLEIDADGQIVGGSYENGRVPDYFWISEPLAFRHGYERLNEMITPKESAL